VNKVGQVWLEGKTMPNMGQPLEVEPVAQFGAVGTAAKVARAAETGGVWVAGDDMSDVTVPLVGFHSEVSMKMSKTVGDVGRELERVP
jgi:hypothetical protein